MTSKDADDVHKLAELFAARRAARKTVVIIDSDDEDAPGVHHG
jgi:hypothetical protein